MDNENFSSFDDEEEIESPSIEVFSESEYPGVKYNEALDKWTATLKKADIVMVATRDTFEEAKRDMINFEKN